MDRRSFLASLGLGGLAMSIPKPLDLLASLPAGVEPPVHVGVASLRGGFALHDVGIIDSESAHDREFFATLNEWKLTVVSRPPDASYFHILSEKPLSACLTVIQSPMSPPMELWTRDVGFSTNISAGHWVQAWFSPTGAPKRPLPRLRALLRVSPEGMPFQPPHGRSLALTVKRAQLEFRRAVELGLVPAKDPYELV